jgi:outer membrane lipoprotein SlyB
MVPVSLLLKLGVPALALAALAGCTPDYSPNTYASNAVQQANKVESAVVVGFRQVSISAGGTVGAVTGGAAGGILGSQSGEIGLNSALGGVGGTLIGGVVGTSIEHITGDTTGWEYIVRKSNGDLLSVTQKEPTPLPIGQKVLVITGNQARIVPDYSAALDPPAASSGKKKSDGDSTGDDKASAKAAAPVAAPVSAAAVEASPAPQPAASASSQTPPAATSTADAPAVAATPVSTSAAAPSPSSEPEKAATPPSGDKTTP